MTYIYHTSYELPFIRVPLEMGHPIYVVACNLIREYTRGCKRTGEDERPITCGRDRR
jgi:hypothetical protein